VVSAISRRSKSGLTPDFVLLSKICATGGSTPHKINNLAPCLIVKDDLDKPDAKEQLNPDLKKYLGNG